MELVDKLEDKMKLIELIVTMAYEAKVNLTDVLGQVGTGIFSSTITFVERTSSYHPRKNTKRLTSMRVRMSKTRL